MNDLLHPALKKSRRVELCTRRGRETEQSLQKSNLFTPRSLEHTGRLHANPGQSFEFEMSATFSGEILPQRFKQVMCKTSQRPGGSVSCAFASPTRTLGMASASFLSNSGSIDPRILVIITRLRMPRNRFRRFGCLYNDFKNLVAAVEHASHYFEDALVMESLQHRKTGS